jgi:hypothetical protein
VQRAVYPALHVAPYRANLGGPSRDRTGDLIVANDALSQLSYRPRLKFRRRVVTPKGPPLTPYWYHRMPIRPLRGCPLLPWTLLIQGPANLVRPGGFEPPASSV